MSALLLNSPDVSAGIDLSFSCYGTAAHVTLFMLPLSGECVRGGGARAQGTLAYPLTQAFEPWRDDRALSPD